MSDVKVVKVWAKDHSAECHLMERPGHDYTSFSWAEPGQLFACGFGCRGCTCGALPPHVPRIVK
jgi:hypothetical protein